MSNAELTHYFPHDSNARSDDKMLAIRSSLGNKAYALYFMVLELMREEDSYSIKANGTLTGRLSMELNEDKNFIKKFLEKCEEVELFRIEDGKLYSEEFLRRMAHKDEKSKQARKAANIRWHGNSNGNEGEEHSGSNADAMREHANRNAKDKDKEKNKDKEKDKEKNKDISSGTEPPEEKYNEFALTTGRGLDYDAIKQRWNECVPEDLQITQMTKKRKRKLKTRYKEEQFSLQGIINSLSRQPFALGQNDRGWIAGFSWIIDSQENYTKILEGFYEDKSSNLTTEDEQLQNLMEWAKEEDEKEEVSNGEN